MSIKSVSEILTFKIHRTGLSMKFKARAGSEAKLRIQKCRDYLDRKTFRQKEPLIWHYDQFSSLCNKNLFRRTNWVLQENPRLKAM